MKLQTKIFVALIPVFLVVFATHSFLDYQAAVTDARTTMEREAHNIRGVLMATRRVYHHQFMESQLPVDDATVGFLPAHALGRISKDLSAWTDSGLTFNNVSDQARNPDNAADETELAAMKFYRENPKVEEKFELVEAREQGEYFHYTRPIWTEAYCLKCHGEESKAPQSIQDRYDVAYGYQEGDLRGLMSIKVPAAAAYAQAWTTFVRNMSVNLGGYVAAFGLIYFLLVRTSVKHLKTLEQGAHELAHGNYSWRSGIQGGDEIASVAAGFDTMAAQIGARKRELTESNQRFHDLVEMAPDATVVADQEGKIIVVNAQTETVFGYRREELLGQLIEILIPTRFQDKHPAQRTTYTKNPEFRPMGRERDLWGMRKDGSEFPVEISLSPIQTKDGVLVASSIRDISERSTAEQALRDSELRSRTLLEGSPVCNKIIDLDLNLQYMSSAGVDQLKINDIEPLYGCSFPPPLYSPPMHALATEHLNRAAKGETSSTECAVNDTEGNEVWFDTTFVPAHDEQGQVAYIIVTSVNITDRKKAEQALKENQERLDLAIRGTSDGLWDWDIETGEEYWSPRFKELLGHKEDEIEASHEGFQKLLHPDDAPLVAEAVRLHLEEDVPYDIELRLQTKSGDYRWFQSRGQAKRDDDGKPYRMTGAIRDITERKQAEADAQTHRDEMAHVARISTMGEMATGIAHELNQPLTAIASYGHAAKLISEESDGEPEQLRELLDKLQGQAIRAGNIVRRLREFVSKTESVRVHVDLNTLVRDVVKLVDPDVRAARTKLTLQLDEHAPNILGDEIQIQQVLVNLIRNALDAMQQTPVEDRHVTISTAIPSDALTEVVVTDSGQGLSTKELDKVFDTFFSTKQEGMGMGLAISRSIVEAHEGKLWAKPNDGPGVSFGFTIERVETDAIGGSTA